MTSETCPVCGVVIEDGKTVKFSYGRPGSRERLYTRVCQYALARGRTGCINQESTVVESEGYLPAPPIQSPEK